ncbi:hypothetical protein BKA64DRAFT_61259 [Cadophora sp. MPI-SDFR-AT-0126]|nr:hypothetical protein BKA64DRAFT_61259 [Leotiomycetes sp. MPI-SDFR-AT-0126]
METDFTPNGLPLSENFSTLGEAVESSWLGYLKQGRLQCCSGTSYATPIAAGAAANMLFYVRMKVDSEERRKEAATCKGDEEIVTDDGSSGQLHVYTSLGIVKARR